MAKVFSINGYFKDTKETFEDLLVAEYNDVPDGYAEEDIFYFGMSEKDLEESLNQEDSIVDFVITSFEEVI